MILNDADGQEYQDRIDPPTPVSLCTKSWGQVGGPRVLLVHGLSGTAGTWWRIGSGLAAAGCEVVAVDVRGHGSSPSSTSYRFIDHAADLTELGGQWDLVVGHSLGGPMSVSLALGAKNVAHLLLIDPVFEIADGDLDVLVAIALSELDPLCREEDLAEAHRSWHPQDCFEKAIGARATSPFVVERCIRDNAPFHHASLLELLEIPVVILGGDPKVGALALAETFAGLANPNVRHRVVEGAGHGVHRERPGAVLDAALDALAI